MINQTIAHISALLNGTNVAPPDIAPADITRETSTPISTGSKDHLRLRTLIMLRWLAITGQTAMVLLIAYGFGYHIRLWLCLSIIMGSAWLNLILSLGRRGTQRARGWEAALQLSFDALQLAFLLGVTGGLNNPFCLMLIAPATVAAANLPTRHGLAVVAVSMAASIALAFWSLDLPWVAGQAFVLPAMYRLGFLAAILVGIVFTAGYAWQAAVESDRMEQALAATQAVLEKEHRLSALGGLAAAAAHELGTPLGTIQVVAREMLHSLKRTDPLYEDAELLVSQSQRCRDILKALSTQPETRDSVYDLMPLQAFLESAAEPYRNNRIAIHIAVEADDYDEAGERILIRRRPEWLHAFSAFIENDVDFARSEVNVVAEVTQGYVSLSIDDDGPGFSPDILSRLGEPYISSRHHVEIAAKAGKLLGAQSHSGMGLGFFIAKTLCEHTGARVTFGNRPVLSDRAMLSDKDGGGAYVRALWPRDQIDILMPETEELT
ncbi:MAG: ActS/PrrB/RegB family redox-sensitive histidine kinase [Asticcacaulis sp.]